LAASNQLTQRQDLGGFISLVWFGLVWFGLVFFASNNSIAH
jgi:hypothetical protein